LGGSVNPELKVGSRRSVRYQWGSCFGAGDSFSRAHFALHSDNALDMFNARNGAKLDVIGRARMTDN